MHFYSGPPMQLSPALTPYRILRYGCHLVVRLGLWRSATENSADRSGHLSTDVITPSLRRTDDLGMSRQARELFNLGLAGALEYGVASADLKPSILYARSRFLERKD